MSSLNCPYFLDVPIISKQYQGLQCLVSVPDAAPAPYPVLVFLHGNGEGGPPPGSPANYEAMLRVHGPLAADANARAAGFLIIAPQLPNPGGNVWPSFAKVVEALGRDLAAELGGDPSRTYLTGFSYGGSGVLDLGARSGAPWTAFWAVDPPHRSAPHVTRPIWVSAGREAGPRQAHYLGLGLGPPGGPPGSSVYELVGPGHGTVARTAYADARPYDWLLAHRT